MILKTNFFKAASLVFISVLRRVTHAASVILGPIKFENFVIVIIFLNNLIEGRYPEFVSVVRRVKFAASVIYD